MVEFKQELNELQNKKDTAYDKLNKLKAESGEAWADLKTGVDKAMSDLKNALESAASHYE
jgi:hypothetical protein